LERYKNEQPVIDSERQLSGRVVDEEVIGALKRMGYMTPQYMIVLDAILTMPGATIEEEYRRHIAAINAVAVFCDVEEGTSSRQAVLSQKRPAIDGSPSTHVKRRECLPEAEDAIALRQAIASVQVDSLAQRPTICFLCVGDPILLLGERTTRYKTPGSLSLSRHSTKAC
jgi:Protein of unknown function (DUF3435)